MKTTQLVKERFEHHYSRMNYTFLRGESLVLNYEDPTIHFVNSVLARFKPMFLGKEPFVYKHLATCQLCIRAGGQSVLENSQKSLNEVGRSQRLTLFEQMGFCVFDAVTKMDTVTAAWEFLTNALHIPAEKLWITLNQHETDVFQHCMALNISEDHIVKRDTTFIREIQPSDIRGTCLYFVYDRGRQSSDCKKSDCQPGCKCGRFIDLGDLIFFGYHTVGNVLAELPHLNIDGGFGLERTVMITEDAKSIYEISTFRPILKEIEKISHKQYNRDPEVDIAMRVILDHVRTLTYAIADGIFPGKKAGGYTLRKLVRRCINSGWELDITSPFLHLVVDAVIDQFAEEHPQLSSARNLCCDLLNDDAKQYLKSLERGQSQFYKSVESSKKSLSSEDIFKLYDTFGLPIEYIHQLARSQNVEVDRAGFDTLLETKRQNSNTEWKNNLRKKE